MGSSSLSECATLLVADCEGAKGTGEGATDERELPNYMRNRPVSSLFTTMEKLFFVSMGKKHYYYYYSRMYIFN